MCTLLNPFPWFIQFVNVVRENGWLSQKSLDLRAYKQDFKLNLLPIYYFWGKEPWYAARNPASPATSTQHWERINENWIRRIRGFSLSLYRENRNAAFFMPSCYAVGAKRALLYAALRAHFCRGQGFIPLSPKMPFYCVTFQYLHQWESGVRWLYDSCRVPVFSNCRDYYILPNVLIVLLFHYIFVHFPNHQYPHVFWTHNHQYFLYP